MIVKHSGSETVFEALTGKADRDDILAINYWCRVSIPGRFRFSSILPTLNGFRRTFWMDDRGAALLFKLRWVNT